MEPVAESGIEEKQEDGPGDVWNPGDSVPMNIERQEAAVPAMEAFET
jgi:hypothetical protein